LGSVVIQLYAGECTPSVDRALEFNCLRTIYYGVDAKNQTIEFFTIQSY